MPDSLQRLRAINPALIDGTVAHGVAAQATLERIIAQPRTTGSPGRLKRWMQVRRTMAVAVLVVLGGGGAIAVADPFGWWSSDHNVARYAVAPQITTIAPSASRLFCTGPGSHVACAANANGGRAYTRMGIVQPTHAERVTAASLRAEIARQVANGQVSAAAASKDLAIIKETPETAFAQARQALTFGSLTANVIASDGNVIVPPADAPEFLVCGSDSKARVCRDLNGDTAVPVGAAIYRAEPTADWHADSSVSTADDSPGLHLSPSTSQLLAVVNSLGQERSSR